MLGPEPQIHLLELPERACHEARADEQGESDGHLSRDEDSASRKEGRDQILEGAGVRSTEADRHLSGGRCGEASHSQECGPQEPQPFRLQPQAAEHARTKLDTHDAGHGGQGDRGGGFQGARRDLQAAA